MARVSQISGQIQIGESGLTPELATVVAGSTGTTTAQLQGKKKQAAGTATLALGGITTVNFLHIVGTDAVTGLPKDFQVNLNAVGVLPASSQFTLLAQVGGVTSIAITTAAGNDTNLDFILAGV